MYVGKCTKVGHCGTSNGTRFSTEESHKCCKDFVEYPIKRGQSFLCFPVLLSGEMA